jgi:Flp pilus assembly pilin Flp
MLKFYVMMKTLARDERGATIVEYGVALIIVGALATGVLATLAGDVNTQFSTAEGLM